MGVDNEKALELTNSTVFHRGRQQKSSRAGQQNNFFIFQPDFSEEISPKNATKHPVAHCKCLQGFAGTLQGNESAGI